MEENNIVSEFGQENLQDEEAKNLDISKKKGGALKTFFLVILGFVIIALGFTFMKWQDYKNFVNKEFTINEQIVEVEKGETMNHIKNKLCDMRIVDNCTYLKVYIWQNKGKYDDVKPGEHYLNGEYTLDSLLSSFNKAPAEKYEKATILEGENMYDISGQVKGEHQDEIKRKLQGLVLSGGYIKTLEEEFPFLADFGDIDSLEGFLYPDTYFFRPSDNESPLFPELLIRTQLKAFKEKVRDKYKDDILNNELTPYEMLTIASFLEKEARDSDQRRMIADVLLKRVKKGQLFQVDISLCYGLDKPYSECTPKIIAENIQDPNNIYNTRVSNTYMQANNTIYTPTPISNPSADAIYAVLHPTKNPYYYYLHDPEGGIHYAVDYNGHLDNKRKYLNN